MAEAADVFYKIVRHGDKAKMTFRGLPKTDEEFDAFLAHLTRLYEPKTQFTMMFDTAGLGAMSLNQKRKFAKGMAKWIDDNADKARAYLTKSAIILRSTFMRAFLKMVFAIRRPASPNQVCSSIPEALKYLGWTEELKHVQHLMAKKRAAAQSKK